MYLYRQSFPKWWSMSCRFMIAWHPSLLFGHSNVIKSSICSTASALFLCITSWPPSSSLSLSSEYLSLQQGQTSIRPKHASHIIWPWTHWKTLPLGISKQTGHRMSSWFECVTRIILLGGIVVFTHNSDTGHWSSD